MGLTTTRSWRSNLAAKQLAVTDLHTGSVSYTVFLGQSSFGRPMVARSLCVRHVHELGDQSSLCRNFSNVFNRAFFDTAQFHVKDGARYMLTRNKILPSWHPCRQLNAIECEQRYLAAVTGRDSP